MKVELEGKLDIIRYSGKDAIEIRLTDALSGSGFISIHVSLREMMEALTAHAARPCTFEYYPHAPVGKERQIKRELVPAPEGHMPDSERDAALLAPFEVDGWKGRAGDLRNHHMRRGEFAEVIFARYVAPSEAVQ